jgi:alkylhydroperoxidase family enzyme
LEEVTLPRIRELPHNEVPEEFSAQLDKVFGAVRDRGTLTGTPGNWWTVWSRVPGILNAFGAYSYTAAPLPAEILELALVRTGYVRASRFVFSQHSKAARRVGVAEDKIAAVPYWSITLVSPAAISR